VQWLPDGRSFLAAAAELNLATATLQIWSVSYPGGERTHVTNDLNLYQGVSLSADGLSLATVQTDVTAGIEVAALPDLSEWRPITGEPGRIDGTAGLTWLPDGRLVYTSATSGPPQLWIVDGDGNHARQLTSTLPVALNPFASPDGRWVYFDSLDNTGRYIYRIAPDGSGLERLTHEGNESRPIVSPDGATVFVSRSESGESHAGRVPSQGGKVEVISKAIFAPSGISPDGAKLVGPTWSQEHRRSVIGLLDAAGGEPTLLPDIPVATANFSVDGRSLIFPDLTARPVRLMVRPLPDGSAKPVGPPITGLTFSGALSRDGRLALSRGTRHSDVVLISAIRSPKPSP
jgi:dipeptidyl aminopeptidase/acylaminoacyl peptidase